jgi:hypothetical protein
VPTAAPGAATEPTSAPSPADLLLSWPKRNYRLLEEGELGPSYTGDLSIAGGMVVYDWDTREVIWESDWGRLLVVPFGFCFADGVLYVTDVEGSHVFAVDVVDEPGRLLGRISHPYLNDLYGIRRTRRGLLVACSGTDAVVELDLQGRLLYDCWAADHGYTETPSGMERTSGRGQEHRNVTYHTRYQATHVNAATFRDDGERYLLALLCNAGELVEIDRGLPPEQQAARVLLDGLARPHGLKKTPGGWLLCNSLWVEWLMLDDELRVVERVAHDGGWIQDCTMLSDGRVLITDADSHCIVEYEGPPWAVRSKVHYDMTWRMIDLVEVPRTYEAGFRRVARTR